VKALELARVEKLLGTWKKQRILAWTKSKYVVYFVHGDGTNLLQRKMKRQQINVERLTVQIQIEHLCCYNMPGKLTLRDFPARDKPCLSTAAHFPMTLATK